MAQSPPFGERKVILSTFWIQVSQEASGRNGQNPHCTVDPCTILAMKPAVFALITPVLCHETP